MLKDFVTSLGVDILWLVGALMLLGLFFAIFIAVFTAVEMTKDGLKRIIANRKYAKRRAWIEEAKAILSGPTVPKFICNYMHGVFAFTPKKSFDEELDRYYGAIGPDGPVNYNPVLLWVPNTYTFASTPDTVRPVHTGDREYLEKSLLLTVMMGYLTGIGLHKMLPFSETEMEELIVCFAKKDARLFVPYCGSVPEGRTQLAIFGVKEPHHWLAEINGMFE
jgi:hypothetical protein